MPISPTAAQKARAKKLGLESTAIDYLISAVRRLLGPEIHGRAVRDARGRRLPEQKEVMLVLLEEAKRQTLEKAQSEQTSSSRSELAEPAAAAASGPSSQPQQQQQQMMMMSNSSSLQGLKHLYAAILGADSQFLGADSQVASALRFFIGGVLRTTPIMVVATAGTTSRRDCGSKL
jgi:hypothetical protein